MPDLIIRIKQKTDGSAALSCTRANGSVTWQRQDGKLGAFFPLHGLTHYCDVRREEVFAKWRALKPGETMEVAFDRAGSGALV